MPGIEHFGQVTGVSVADLIAISERQVTVPGSQLFERILSQVADKWVARTKAVESAEAVRKKKRAYVPYAVGPTDKYRIAAAFPQFEIRYTASVRMSAPFARTVSLMMSEYMYTLTDRTERNVILYGYPILPTLMRNRSWAHMCVPTADPFAQFEYMEQDRQIVLVSDSMARKQKTPPQALSAYLSATGNQFCTSPHQCSAQANVGLMMLDRVDTNFRQVCHWMRSHGVKLCFFAIPGNKAMELGVDDHFPELDAYVVNQDNRVGIVYRGDAQWQTSYDRNNYLELIARSRYMGMGCTFRKEFVSRHMGYLVYKVTCLPGVHNDPISDYKSWPEPNYRNKYLIRAPVLGVGADPRSPGSWSTNVAVVDKALVDEVLAMAINNDDKKIDDEIARKLFSASHNYIVSNQLVRCELQMPVSTFHTALVLIYCVAFMRKFRSGAAVSTLAPEARKAVLGATASPMQLVKAYTTQLVSDAVGHYTGAVYAATVGWVDALTGRRTVPLPEYELHPGFIAYGQGESNNPNFHGWTAGAVDPYEGFTASLPGIGSVPDVFAHRFMDLDMDTMRHPEMSVMEQVRYASAGVYQATRAFFLNEQRDWDPVAALEAINAEGDVCDAGESLASGAQVDERVVPGYTPARFVEPTMRRRQLGDLIKESPVDAKAYTDIADALVDRVLTGVGDLRARTMPYAFSTYLVTAPLPERIPGAVSTHPLEDMRQALMKIFPSSLVMDTSRVESQRLYGPADMSMRTTFAKIDLSRLEALKPESVFRPKLRGHPLPNIKENFINVVNTLADRNTDTPYDMDDMEDDVLWKRVLQAMYKVYYRQGAEHWLAEADYIGPSEEAIREWCAKQEESKVRRLVAPGVEYDFTQLILGTHNLHLMLKGALKPSMSESYETALKFPQTVQYDSSGKSVAVLSPIIREKVKREQFLLKPNVLVMQRKSYDDMVNFLNTFDHRPDERGERYYIEIDQKKFDKSQVGRTARMYLKRLAQFKVLPEYVTFVGDHMHRRYVSSMNAGVKLLLDEQNISGAAFTLDRNNDVSMVAMAMLLAELGPSLEFVMVMGDDMTIAVRGKPRVSHWDAHLNKFWNLSAKVQVHRHGYICSMDIVHLDCGGTVLVRDIVKAMLGFMKQDHKDESKFHEMWISFCDGMRYVGDLRVQRELARCLPDRWGESFPGITGDAFLLCAKAHAGLVASYEAFRAMQSDALITKFH